MVLRFTGNVVVPEVVAAFPCSRSELVRLLLVAAFSSVSFVSTLADRFVSWYVLLVLRCSCCTGLRADALDDALGGITPAVLSKDSANSFTRLINASCTSHLISESRRLRQ